MSTVDWCYFGLWLLVDMLNALMSINICRSVYKRHAAAAQRRKWKDALTYEAVSVVVPCYLPNEKAIIHSTIDHICSNVTYPGDVTLHVVYNTPCPLPAEEARLAELDGTKHGALGRTVRVHHVAGSRSKAENLNHVIGAVLDPAESRCAARPAAAAAVGGEGARAAGAGAWTVFDGSSCCSCSCSRLPLLPPCGCAWLPLSSDSACPPPCAVPPVTCPSPLPVLSGGRRYVAIFDADHHPDADCLSTLMVFLLQNEVDCVQVRAAPVPALFLPAVARAACRGGRFSSVPPLALTTAPLYPAERTRSRAAPRPRARGADALPSPRWHSGRAGLNVHPQSQLCRPPRARRQLRRARPAVRVAARQLHRRGVLRHVLRLDARDRAHRPGEGLWRASMVAGRGRRTRRTRALTSPPPNPRLSAAFPLRHSARALASPSSRPASLAAASRCGGTTAWSTTPSRLSCRRKTSSARYASSLAAEAPAASALTCARLPAPPRPPAM